MSTIHSRSRRRRRGGFTLMEVLLVLVILVILGSFAVFAYSSAQKQSRVNAAKSQIGLFKTPLEMFQLNLSQYPTTSQGLEALRQPPSDLSNQADWQGPYLIEPVPNDPWGTPYQYTYPGTRNTDRYDLWSVGPDKQNGTDDDIGNWIQES
jgi:general secretion pathway protein G